MLLQNHWILRLEKRSAWHRQSGSINAPAHAPCGEKRSMCFITRAEAGSSFPAGSSQSLLFVAAFLAGKLHPDLSRRRRDAIGRAAFPAFRLDAGLALLDCNGLALHALLDKTLGLFAHCLLGHVSPLPKIGDVARVEGGFSTPFGRTRAR